MKKIGKKGWIAIGVIAVILIAWFFLRGGKKEEKITFETAKVENTSIHTSITATGTIEPVTSVTVGTQVSGIVSHLYVDYNSVVKKGQVIAELDRTNLISELNTSKANLSSAQSTAAYEQANYNRYKTLYEKGLVSADEFESAQLSYLKAKEQVNTSRESVQKAQTNLGYATITSPIDGVILSKAVEEGQTVAASFNTPELFVIAQDLTDMRVIADIDEADIGGVKEGQRVSFTVDAFPEDKFDGTVTQVRQEAKTESNVVTYEVVISAFTMEKDNVLAVPAKALRFHPSEAVLQEGESISDCEGDHKLWTKEGSVFKAHKVEVGTSNGVMTEITGGIAAGTEVLADFEISGGAAPEMSQQGGNPFMPRPRNNRQSGSQGGSANGGGNAQPRR